MASARPELQVGGFDEAESFAAEAGVPFALISLLSQEEKGLYGLPDVDPRTCRDHLWVDVADVPEGYEGAMTPGQAREIAEFARGLAGNVRVLFIHCAAGHSRSPAVAAALSKAWTGDDGLFRAGRQPNEHVYELVLDALERWSR